MKSCCRFTQVRRKTVDSDRYATVSSTITNCLLLRPQMVETQTRTKQFRATLPVDLRAVASLINVVATKEPSWSRNTNVSRQSRYVARKVKIRAKIRPAVCTSRGTYQQIAPRQIAPAVHLRACDKQTCETFPFQRIPEHDLVSGRVPNFEETRRAQTQLTKTFQELG